ncbi:hypothetical protein [Mesobacterium pallidum]|nr:hypothetical protein [Mesobacterium pallidum]
MTTADDWMAARQPAGTRARIDACPARGACRTHRSDGRLTGTPARPN